ncbi:MAG: 2,3-dimethylmalate dehydratase large subunit [Desulfovibrio sp.]
MSMHAVEKILAAKAGKETVVTGEIVNCNVDLAGINDLYLQTVRSFFEIGGKQVKNPHNVVIFMDHYAPASTIMQAENQKQFRKFAAEQGIEHVMDIDQGVCHQVVIDHGLSRPGKLMVITDSHTTTHGALGAFGTGVGATDLATIMLTGQLWFRVPEVIRINLEGELRPGVFAKDIILHVIGSLKADYGVYRAVEFTGSAVKRLSMSERFALCNMTTEMGAKTSWIQPDETTLEFLKAKGISEYTVYETDPGYAYFAEHTFDVSQIEPQLAAPHSVDNVDGISKFEGVEVQQAYLGTCTGGRLEDLAVAAKILKGKKIHKGTRFIVVPASKKVLLDAMQAGVMQTLVEAGATFVTPGCAACLGVHEGMLASGETCITSSSRNFPGRMGSGEAGIYIGSPASVAAAALTGKLTDPSRFLA